MTSTVLVGDCREVMAGMEPGSIDAIVTDPPYGLEFMGKDWDRLDGGLPQEGVWKGRRGKGGSDVDTRPAAEMFKSGVARVNYGGKKSAFKRCTICGKRQFSGSPCRCAEPVWTIEYPEGAPSGMIRQQRWHEAWAREAFRVLKPGGHLLAFGGTRTFHRLACALEDAGFEIRDTLSWLYGSGFPKSLDVGKALDKAAGAEREVVGTKHGLPGYSLTQGKGGLYGGGFGGNGDGERECAVTAPATDLARQWDGWGTALKPAWEPVIVARKPLSGTVAANVAAHGTGALNIDGCRIVRDPNDQSGWAITGSKASDDRAMSGPNYARDPKPDNPSGRWPANVALDDDAAALLDAQAGELKPATSRTRRATFTAFRRTGPLERDVVYPDSGGPSRFFYCAKASRSERNAGLDGASNGHPTVKPVALMRWLVRLVAPPGGLVLDPFAGSFTTGVAAILEGVDFVGIEQDAEYAEIARRRIAHAEAQAEAERAGRSPAFADLPLFAAVAD